MLIAEVALKSTRNATKVVRKNVNKYNYSNITFYQIRTIIKVLIAEPKAVDETTILKQPKIAQKLLKNSKLPIRLENPRFFCCLIIIIIDSSCCWSCFATVGDGGSSNLRPSTWK